MKLYGSVVSPFVQRVLIAARLKGHEIPVEAVPGGSLQSEAFAAISPMRRIPVLEADGWTIAESATIIAFLDETLDGPALLPAAPRDRARARTIAGLVDTEVAAGLRPFVVQKLFGACGESAVLDHARRQLDLGLDAVERVRETGLPWAAGEVMTLADAALFPFLILGGIIEANSDSGPVCSGRPELDAYRERMAIDPLGARVREEMEQGFARMMAPRHSRRGHSRCVETGARRRYRAGLPTRRGIRRFMAGHSKYKNIMHRKGAQDKKRSALFSKLSREITVAAKAGLPDPDMNARLRSAVIAARAQSMPNDNIQRAINKASGGDSENYEEVRYEGFGPGGVSLIIESLTDNRNRTATNVRTAVSKNGGNLGASGSVSHAFDRLGLISYPAKAGDAEKVFEAALEAGAEDVTSSEDGHEIWTAQGDLHEVAKALEPVLGEAEGAKLAWRPQTNVSIDEGDATTLFKLIDTLDEDDDVQAVWANYDISDEVAAKLGG